MPGRPAAVVCFDGAVAGAVNLRDLGGYPAAGGRVRAGVVYRSGMMHHIPPPGLRWLREHAGIRTVLDLRSDEELARDGVSPFAAAGIAHQHTPVFAKTDQTEEARREQWRQMRDGVYDWTSSYQRMAEQGGAAFARLFAVLAAGEQAPLVFHCTAGRDRTGVAAALLLGALGVDTATIAHDYHLTGGLLQPHAARFLRPGAQGEMTEAQMARVLATSEQAMTAFLAWLAGRYGGIDGYLYHIGVTPHVLAAVRAGLVDA